MPHNSYQSCRTAVREIAYDCARVEHRLAVLKCAVLELQIEHILRKAGFDPNQPHWPAGAPGSIGGRWRPAGGSERINVPAGDTENIFPARMNDPATPIPERKPFVPPLPRHAPRNLTISNEGVSFLKRRERFEPFVYLDQGGVPTIGYGHVILPDESFPYGITEAEAQRLLRQDVSIAENTVRRWVKVPLTQSQFDALTSVAYNVGPAAFREPVKKDSKIFKDTILLQRINAEDFEGAANQILEFNKVRDQQSGKLKVSQGLANRRKMDRDIFLHGIYR